jgi:hypothetical protein
LTGLQRLLLQGTKVTDAGSKTLQQALPKCVMRIAPFPTQTKPPQ